jgi:hypothetical protein
MSYDYAVQRKDVFTERGVEILLQVRDDANRLLEASGAFLAAYVMKSGDSWVILACLDYMVERGEIREITKDVWAQNRVFVRG